MSIEASSDLEEFFRLNITFDVSQGLTIETRSFSDRARRVRQATAVTKWRNTTCLGQGSSGVVWLQQEDEVPDKCRAIKEIRKGTPSAPLPVDYRRELLALGRLSKREDLFVRFLGWYESNQSVYLAMEYFDQGDLGQHLSAPLAEDEVRVISKQLSEGLAVLHGQNWAHRDLKPPNIFVVDTSPWWVKIGDFGISKRIRSGNTRFQTVIGTLDFVAPEVLNLVSEIADEDTGDEEDEYTVAVDMWSLGCVMFQLLTLETPFANRRKLGSYCRSKLEKFPLLPLDQAVVSAAATEVIRGLLEPIPSHRTTADAALRCEWIQGVSASSDNDYASQEQLKVTSSSDYGSDHRRVKASSLSKSFKPGIDGGSMDVPSTSVYSLNEQTGGPASVKVSEKLITTEQRPNPRNPASTEDQTSFNISAPREPVPDLDRPALRMANQAARQKEAQEANKPLYSDHGLQKQNNVYNSGPVEQAQSGSTPRVQPVSVENVPKDGQRKIQHPQSTGARKALLVCFDLPGQDQSRNSGSILATNDYLVRTLHYRSEDIVCLAGLFHNLNDLRKDLKNGMAWLVEAAKPGDSMFLQFSGYGLDKELFNALTHPIPKAARLTILLDVSLSRIPLKLEYIYEATQSSPNQEPNSRATRSIHWTRPLPTKWAKCIQKSEGDIFIWYCRSKAPYYGLAPGVVPISKRLIPILYGYPEAQLKQTYHDILNLIPPKPSVVRNFRTTAVLASNHPIDLDSPAILF